MTQSIWRVLAIAALAAVVSDVSPASAQTAPSLGSAQSFAILSGSTVTNTGSTVITGDLGVSPGTAVTGFPPGVVVGGVIHSADAAAQNAQTSLTDAFNQLTSQACTQDLTGQNLGGLTLTPGVYCFSTTAALTGTLTLDALGNPNSVFIFKIGSTLTTASGSSVTITNAGAGATLCNIFWQIGSSATLGTNSAFAGNILAQSSITLTTGATVNGRALARSGAVTLDSNNVTATCAVPAVCPPIAMTPATLPGGTVAVAYTQTLTGSGGTAPYVFSLAGGALPPGLLLTPTGVVTGTPTTVGTYTASIRATDANGCTVVLVYTIPVIAAAIPPGSCPPITLTPPTLPAGAITVPYSVTITGSGGTAPYTFGVTTGTLPAGMTLTATGVLAGVPTTVGDTPLTIRGTDVNGCFAEVPYTLAIVAAVPPPGCPAITLSPASLPNGTLAVAYNQTITGAGGTGPYTFRLLSGALPTGMTLTAAGVLSGTPTSAGEFQVTIRGTDVNGCFADAPYTMSVVTAVPTMPEVFAFVLALSLGVAGYLRLRNRRPAAE